MNSSRIYLHYYCNSHLILHKFTCADVCDFWSWMCKIYPLCYYAEELIMNQLERRWFRLRHAIVLQILKTNLKFIIIGIICIINNLWVCLALEILRFKTKIWVNSVWVINALGALNSHSSLYYSFNKIDISHTHPNSNIFKVSPCTLGAVVTPQV